MIENLYIYTFIAKNLMVYIYVNYIGLGTVSNLFYVGLKKRLFDRESEKLGEFLLRFYWGYEIKSYDQDIYKDQEGKIRNKIYFYLFFFSRL